MLIDLNFNEFSSQQQRSNKFTLEVNEINNTSDLNRFLLQQIVEFSFLCNRTVVQLSHTIVEVLFGVMTHSAGVSNVPSQTRQLEFFKCVGSSNEFI